MSEEKKLPQEAPSYDVKYDPKMAEEKVLLSVRRLKQYFASGEYRTKAVHDVSFDVKEGECFGIVGESGCGKTTTGRTIIGLDKPTSGEIYYKGYRIAGGTRFQQKEIKYSRLHAKEKIADLEEERTKALEEAVEPAEKINARIDEQIAKIKEELSAHIAEQKAEIKAIEHDNKHAPKALRREIQMIFQDPIDSLDPRMTVEDIIQEGLHIQGKYNRASNQEAVEEALRLVGLIPEYASRYPHEFSGGQRQRIGIARALYRKVKLLILDEATSALDAETENAFCEVLRDLRGKVTLLVISHRESTLEICDRRISL